MNQSRHVKNVFGSNVESPKLDFCHIFLTVGVKCLRLVCHHKVVILISGQIAICVSLKNFLWIILGELETRMVFLQPVLSNFVQSFWLWFHTKNPGYINLSMLILMWIKNFHCVEKMNKDKFKIKLVNLEFKSF